MALGLVAEKFRYRYTEGNALFRKLPDHGSCFFTYSRKHLARYRSVLLGRFLFVWFVTLFAIGITPATWWGQLTMIFGSIFLGWGISSLHRIGRTYGAVVFFILASLVALLHGMPHPY